MMNIDSSCIDCDCFVFQRTRISDGNVTLVKLIQVENNSCKIHGN